MQETQLISISAVLERSILQHAGFSWPVNPRAKELKKLVEAVHAISEHYSTPPSNAAANVFKKPELRSAYLAYYLPVNLVKLFPVLDELFAHPEANCFQGSAPAILDLGCGPGTFLLGVLEYLAKNWAHLTPPEPRVELWGVDQIAENVSLAQKIIAEYVSSELLPQAINWSINIIPGSITAPHFPYPLLPDNKQFDLIIAGNVVTELGAETSSFLARRLEQLLTAHGSLILIDPGTRQSSRNLVQFRDILLEQTALNLYAPCLDQGLCPALYNPKDWCHQKLVWVPTEMVKVIDYQIRFTKQKGIQYCYFTFRKDGKSISDTFTAKPKANIWRVVSYPIRNKGEQRLFVCNGRERMLLRRLTKNASERNRDFPRAQRGDCVFVADCVKRERFLEITRDSTFGPIKKNET